VPATLSTSCNLLIFAEDAAEPVVSFDLVNLGWRGVGSGREGRKCTEDRVAAITTGRSPGLACARAVTEAV
jgi:hypothetical protein